MFSKDFKEISAGELISITGGLMAGMILAHIKEELILIPGLLILIPGFLEMKGNIDGSLSSRLSSALHMGNLLPKIQNSAFLRQNIYATTLLSLIVSIILGVMALLVTYIYYRVIYIKILYISIAAVVLSNLILNPITIVTCFWLFKHGHDPDNIMGPYVTTVGDVISLISLFIVVAVIA